MLSKMDLHISAITRSYGGALNLNKPPSITEERLVPIRVMPDNSKRFMLEPTVGYIVSFRESVPAEIINAGYSVWFDLSQPDLIQLGAYMLLNWHPFEGFLLATQPMTIEVGSRLATVSWDVFTDEEETDVTEEKVV
jgi:hypothetical protein